MIQFKTLSTHTSHIQSLFNQTYGRLKEEDAYKILMMERKDLVHGEKAMEKLEPGYLQSVRHGLNYFKQTLCEPISANWFETMHDQTTLWTQTDDYPEGIPSGFRNNPKEGEAFGLSRNQTMSKDGVNELQTRYTTLKVDGDKFLPQFMINPADTIRWEEVPTNEGYESLITTHNLQQLTLREVSIIFKRENINEDAKAVSKYIKDKALYASSAIRLKPLRKETAKWIFETFYDLYKQASKKTQIEKLQAIAGFCQNLEQAHLFFDGNVRTTGFFLLNKLLLENNLFPTSLEDVNRLDCLSINELIHNIQEGQEYFQSLLQKN